MRSRRLTRDDNLGPSRLHPCEGHLLFGEPLGRLSRRHGPHAFGTDKTTTPNSHSLQLTLLHEFVGLRTTKAKRLCRVTYSVEQGFHRMLSPFLRRTMRLQGQKLYTAADCLPNILRINQKIGSSSLHRAGGMHQCGRTCATVSSSLQ